MKKINKKEKGAALINVMLVVLVAVAIGLPLLYLVIVNFTFRMFDNNLRGISYKNEMGMDNVYAIIQEIVIEKTNIAKEKAKATVDAQVKAEQDTYKEWIDDGRKKVLPGEDGIIDTDDDKISEDDDLDKLKDYMKQNGVITEEEYKNINSEDIDFKYLEISDGSILNQAVKDAYNTFFKTFYKEYMDGIIDYDNNGILDDDLDKELKEKAKSDSYKMKDLIDDNLEEQYAIATSDYKTYAVNANDTTNISVKVSYKGLSETTKKYIKSDVSAAFTIGVPEFDSASSINQTTVKISNPLLDKTLVLGATINVASNRTLTVIGETIVSGEVEEGAYAVDVGQNSKLNIDGDFAVNGDVRLAGGTESNNNEFNVTGDVFCNEIITAGPYTNTKIDKALYIYDDMEIGQNYTTMDLESLIAFNDIQPNETTLIEAPEEKTSAILFNNAGIQGLDFKVNNAYLFGTAFIGDTTYKTGESMAIKGNYRVYQFPLIGDAEFSADNMTFNSIYSGISLVDSFMNGAALTNEQKAKYFNKVVSTYATDANKQLDLKNISDIKINNMNYSTGMWYSNSTWELPQNADNYDIASNAVKTYEKYTKYFGYGEGNQYKLINGEIPTVIGDNGWIKSNELTVAAGVKEYKEVTDSDTVVLVSDGDITLTEKIDGKKGIVIARGNITVDRNDTLTNETIHFKGAIICGGKLIVNDNFKLEKDSIAVQKIIESGVSVDNKELFEIFRDDESGNLYNYSTIDTQIASINMNELIKISDWNKSKFDI